MMKSKPRVRRYVTFTTEVEGEKLHNRLSYWQFMFRFVLFPTITIAAALFLIRIFFSEGK